jgi:hypothetical protein
MFIVLEVRLALRVIVHISNGAGKEEQRSNSSVCPDMTIQHSNNIRSDDTMGLSWTSIILQ